MSNDKLEDERIAFEEWVSGFDSGSSLERDEDGYYYSFDVQRAWAGWNARASQESVKQARPQAAQPRKTVTKFNVGQFVLSEDDCIELGIDFPAYEKGVRDAAEAFHSIPTGAHP